MQISEKEIEDRAEYDVHRFVHPNANTLARQFTLPSGRRADLIVGHREVHGMGDYIITVVEIKAVRATLDDLCQLLEYVDELTLGRYRDTPIHGILLAPGFDQRVVGAARRMIDIGTHTFEIEIDFGFAPLVPASGWEVSHVRTDPAVPRPWSDNSTVREVVYGFTEKLVEIDRSARQWHPSKRRSALVPMADARRMFSTPNGSRG